MLSLASLLELLPPETAHYGSLKAETENLPVEPAKWYQALNPEGEG